MAAFWAIALLLIAVPGADWAFVLGTVLGGWPVLPAVGGLAVGYAGMSAVVAAGAGAVLAHSPAALTVVTVAGGLYLVWLGARTLARAAVAGPDAAADHGAADRGASPSGGRALLVRGIGVSGLNPKGLLVLLALLPQFASPHGGWPLPAQLGLLGAVFTVTCVSFHLCLGAAARRLLRGRPGTAATLTRAAGAAMIVIGAALLAERLLG